MQVIIHAKGTHVFQGVLSILQLDLLHGCGRYEKEKIKYGSNQISVIYVFT